MISVGLIGAAIACTPNAAQQPTSPRPSAVMGTYALGTTSPPWSGDGCWLETAPVAADSMRLQMLCRRPAPGHHLGMLDARLPFRRDTLVYEKDEGVGHCRIEVRFVGDSALVNQAGIGANGERVPSDQACGFGAYVDVSGKYVRLNKRRPPFDLSPF